MEQNTKQKVKLIMVDENPYVVSLDKVEIGDKVIVTVGGQYPSIVECQNETVLNLLTDSKLSLTQAFKIFMEPQFIKFTPEQIEKILENDGMMEVQFDGDKYNYSL
jgi:hydrogenase maturation factor